jgi:hypothetical protein
VCHLDHARTSLHTVLAARSAGRASCYEGRVAEKSTSGKRVVIVLLSLALGVALLAWFAASRIERATTAGDDQADAPRSVQVLRDGVLYEAHAGDPGLVIAKEVASGKELWRAELGSVTATPALVVEAARVEVEIAGTPWMSLDRQSGEPVE